MFFKKLLNKGYEAEECEICNTEFNVLRFQRIHKCKRCQKFICNNCGKGKEYILDEKGDVTPEKHRICTSCQEDHDKITQAIAKYQMKWGADSPLSQGWMRLLKEEKDKDYEYNHFLNLFFKNPKNFEEETDIIDKDVNQGRTDYTVFNYSMREFFYKVQINTDKPTARVNISHVLYALAARFDRIGYCQGMSGIAAFILCFSAEETAFIIFCDLLENIFPQKFFVRSNFGVSLIGLIAEIYFLKEYYEYYVTKVKHKVIEGQRQPYNEDQMNQIKLVIDLLGAKALLSIFIGVLSFSNLIFVWKELNQKRTFLVVEKAFIAIMFISRNVVLEHRSYKKLESFFEKINPKEFKQVYQNIEIDKDLKKQLIQKYYMDTSKKWNENSKGNIANLTKVTTFNQNEIMCLQNFFSPKAQIQILNNTVAIDEIQFLHLIQCYYEVLKENSEEDEPILEISPYFLRQIFTSYNANNKSGLDFREFICCLSVCTKSQLKDRMCAIINTFEDKHHYISYENFNKLIKNLCLIGPEGEKKQSFLERMNRCFSKQDKISINELYILLNDDFINQLSFHIKSQCQNIIELTVRKYHKQAHLNHSNLRIFEV